MSSSANAIFTGSSQFSNDFQQVIQRAVAFASLPMHQMQNDVAALQSQASEFNTLKSNFSSLQSAVSGLNTSVGLASFNGSVSTPAVASVSLSGSPTVGSYSLEVISAGSKAGAMSNDGLPTVSEPSKANLSDATVFTLTVGTTDTTIVPADGTLAGLVSAINRSAAGVEASMVNVGTTASPDYRLSLQNSKLAATTIQLKGYDGSNAGTTLLTKQADGAAATYRINGVPKPPAAPLSSDSPTITIAPGVSVMMLDAGSTTITVARNAAVISNALTNFATAYNSAVSELNKNRGDAKGALVGQSVVQSLSQALHRISSYNTGANGISSLTALGVRFDSDGVLSLDSTAFNAVASKQLDDMEDFLGSTTGGGFLKFANDALTGVNDATSGIISSGITSVNSQITRENKAITPQQDRVDTLQLNLNHRMAAADSAIAALEQQYTFLSSMFLSMRVNSQNA
jgi:flagellar hook-associated protein 2